jgi:hypothetical protein
MEGSMGTTESVQLAGITIDISQLGWCPLSIPQRIFAASAGISALGIGLGTLMVGFALPARGRLASPAPEPAPGGGSRCMRSEMRY